MKKQTIIKKGREMRINNSLTEREQYSNKAAV